jgi:hypothetical protein
MVPVPSETTNAKKLARGGNVWTLALEFFVRGGRGIAAHGYEFRCDADGNLFRR